MLKKVLVLSDTLLVSVCMITYNHEKFIAEAIEGVLMQEVDFEVELIIADDASTDRTGEVVQSYINTHPRGSWIKYTGHPVNKGMIKNFIWALEHCKGDYIALCDGDDYWIDKNKLMSQVDLLESNPSFVLSFHPVNVLFQNGNINIKKIEKSNIQLDQCGLYDLALYGNFIHTPSVLFRNVITKIPNYFQVLQVGDFFLYLFLAKEGVAVKQDFLGAVYRFGTGSFSGESISKIRRRFKISLKITSQHYSNFLIRIVLWLRFHQDNLYPVTSTIRKGNPKNNVFILLYSLSFLQVLKALLKALLGVEKRRIKE